MPTVGVDVPRIIAHRGASGHAPENTNAAFRKAAELGATWVEFDHVDFGVAVNHPLGQILAATTALGDADGRACTHPEILQARGRAKQGVAVGCV